MAVSRHGERISELETRARAQAEEALQHALTQAATRSEESSSKIRTVATIRRRVVESAVGWIDAALKANFRRLERRRRRRREQERQRAGAVKCHFLRVVLLEGDSNGDPRPNPRVCVYAGLPSS